MMVSHQAFSVPTYALKGGILGAGVGLFAGMLVGNAMDKSNLKTLDKRLEAKKEIDIANQENLKRKSTEENLLLYRQFLMDQTGTRHQ